MSWMINFSKVVSRCDECPLCEFRKDLFKKHGVCYSCIAEDEYKLGGFYVGYPTKYRPCPIVKQKKFDYNKKFKICLPKGLGALKITNWWINNNYIVVESTWDGRHKYTNMFNIDGTPVDAIFAEWYPGEGSDYMFLENCDGGSD